MNGCQTCYGAIDINQNGYNQLSYNSHYYIINHMSSVVALVVRIGNTSRTVNDSKITHAEFVNPDGSYVAVIINEGDEAKSINLSDGTHNLPARFLQMVSFLTEVE